MEDAASQAADAGTGNGTDVVVDKPTWNEQLPEDLRGNEAFHSHQTIGDFAKSYLDLQSEREGLLKVPGEDATDEDRNAFYSKMGRPEAPEGYELGQPEGWPENVPYSAELEADFRTAAHEGGMSSKDAATAYNWFTKSAVEAHKEEIQVEKAAMDTAINELKDEWKGDTFKVNTELAHRAFGKYAGEGGNEFIENTMVEGIALGNHPTFLKMFAEIGKTISDDNAFTERSGLDVVLSDEAKALQRFPNTNHKKE